MHRWQDKVLSIKTSVSARRIDLDPTSLIGLSMQMVADNGNVAGRGLPLIVISHGNYGLLSSHSDTALALASAGFVVAAVTRTGDNARMKRSFASCCQRRRTITPFSAPRISFLAPCPSWLFPLICKDANGFDRVAFHRDFNRDVVAFFQSKLAAK